MKVFTAQEFREYIKQYTDAPQRGHVIRRINTWLARGDGAAVYENQDLGHPDVGSCRITSYGSPQAQLEVAEPPVTLPDIGGQINWRYQLVATYRGEPL